MSLPTIPKLAVRYSGFPPDDFWPVFDTRYSDQFNLARSTHFGTPGSYATFRLGFLHPGPYAWHVRSGSFNLAGRVAGTRSGPPYDRRHTGRVAVYASCVRSCSGLCMPLSELGGLHLLSPPTGCFQVGCPGRGQSHRKATTHVGVTRGPHNSIPLTPTAPLESYLDGQLHPIAVNHTGPMRTISKTSSVGLLEGGSCSGSPLDHILFQSNFVFIDLESDLPSDP